MDKLEKIRQEIERRIKLYDGNNTQELWIGNTYRAVLSFLDTLSEEPDKSLEEAAEKYCEKVNHRQTTIITDSFKAGAEWQKEKMLKEAMEGTIVDAGFDDHTALVSIPDKRYDEGDKVRIIIVKEENK